MAEKGIVLSLCDRTTVGVQDWLADGYECWAVDIQHPKGETKEGRLTKIGADICTWFPPPDTKVAFVMAYPPCTDMAVSGARWFKSKGLKRLAHAIEMVAACAEIAEAFGSPYFIENPVSTLATYWRKPDYTFHPHEYAGYLSDPSDEAYTKKTCLWTGGGYVHPPTKSVKPSLGSKMHLLPPTDDRGDLRSVTPKGFAKAVYLSNRRSDG